MTIVCTFSFFVLFHSVPVLTIYGSEAKTFFGPIKFFKKVKENKQVIVENESSNFVSLTN